MSASPLLTVQQVADRLAVPADHVRVAIRRRPTYRVSEQQVDAYLRARTTAA